MKLLINYDFCLSVCFSVRKTKLNATFSGRIMLLCFQRDWASNHRMLRIWHCLSCTLFQVDLKTAKNEQRKVRKRRQQLPKKAGQGNEPIHFRLFAIANTNNKSGFFQWLTLNPNFILLFGRIKCKMLQTVQTVQSSIRPIHACIPSAIFASISSRGISKWPLDGVF